MKFKEIKPGMVIHCPREEDARALLEHLDGLGYKWYGEAQITKNMDYDCKKNNCYHIASGMALFTGTLENYKSDPTCEITEFSDLIEPESTMTAKEVIKWLMVKPNAIIAEVLGYENLNEVFRHNSVESILEQIATYEATKKKPVEIEWVQLCRIIQTKDDGTKKVVYEQNLKPETPFDEDPDQKEQTETILKKYISGHEGRYIAVIEDVCRVKEG